MVMLNNRTTKAALFAIAIASSLIVASGGIIGSAFAAKKLVKSQMKVLIQHYLMVKMV